MTKYILNSGNISKFPEKENKLAAEILKGFYGEVKILYCFFSQAREKWEGRYERYKNLFH